MSVPVHKPRYHSYLLRLWLSNDLDEPVWRASLEKPQTGERLAFASLERLFAFLQDQTSGVTGGEVWQPRAGKGAD